MVNAWASWCTPCRAEFPLFASASAHYGRQVAFLGVDTNDSASDGRAFLAQHPVSYPSYQSSSTQLSSLAVIEGMPTTIFVDRAGRSSTCISVSTAHWLRSRTTSSTTPSESPARLGYASHPWSAART